MTLAMQVRAVPRARSCLAIGLAVPVWAVPLAEPLWVLEMGQAVQKEQVLEMGEGLLHRLVVLEVLLVSLPSFACSFALFRSTRQYGAAADTYGTASEPSPV